MAPLLWALYESEEMAEIPGDLSAEIVAAESAVAVIAGEPRPIRGAGFRRSAAQRKEIEMHAMDVARAYFEAEDWSVTLTYKSKPYDFVVERGAEKRWVEVKGTTSVGSQVLLTRGEVEHMRSVYPGSFLGVVSGILLTGTREHPIATGGELRIIQPWQIEEDSLQPIAYRYDLP